MTQNFKNIVCSNFLTEKYEEQGGAISITGPYGRFLPLSQPTFLYNSDFENDSSESTEKNDSQKKNGPILTNLLLFYYSVDICAQFELSKNLIQWVVFESRIIYKF